VVKALILAGRCVRHHLTLLNATPAVEQTAVVPALVRAVEQVDAPPVAVAARTADALPRAACIDAPAGGLAAENRSVAADCTAAQAVKAQKRRWSSALRARAVAHGLHVRDPHRVRDR
jgi:hypothetical protein